MHAYTCVYKSNIDRRYAHAIALLPTCTCNGRLQRGCYVYEKLQRDKMAYIY